MSVRARTPLAVLAGLAIIVGAPAALHISGTTTATSSVSTAIGGMIITTTPGKASTTSSASTPAVPTSFPKMGMNLEVLGNSSGESPLLDRFKMANTWYARDGSYLPSQLDANGWPRTMPTSGYWELGVPLDSIGSNTNDRYRIRWKGTGQVVLNLVGETQWGDHEAVFQNVNGGVLLDIRSDDPNDPVHDITIVRTDQAALYDAGKLFNPDFINRVVKPFPTFRTMDWDWINGSKEVNWADRQKPTDAVFTRMPIEYEVALANEAGVDLWKNIPSMASDAYVKTALTYIKNNLRPDLKVHVEYSNEMWNGAFQQSQWAAQQANAKWKISVWAANTYYGYRAAQVAAAGWTIFGKNSTQYRPVFASWYGWLGTEVTDAMTQGVAFAKGGTVGSLFREYAVANYFGDALGFSPFNQADQGTILNWANDPTGAGLDKAFQQLEHGGLLQAQLNSLDDAKYTFYPKHVAFAKANNLDLVTYEGGLSFVYFMAPGNSKPALQDFYKRLLADPRMNSLYLRWAADFKAAGGTTMMAYNDVGPLNEFGPWGAMDSIYSPATPRFSALMTAAGK